MISTILIFLSVETSLDKEKNRSHTHTSNHLSLTNKSTFKTSNKKIWISFRFVNLNESVCYNDIQWIRYNDHQKHMRCFLRFFTSSQSILQTKMNLLHHSNDTRANDMKRWRTTVNMSLLRSQFSLSFSRLFVNRQYVNILSSSNDLRLRICNQSERVD